DRVRGLSTGCFDLYARNREGRWRGAPVLDVVQRVDRGSAGIFDVRRVAIVRIVTDALIFVGLGRADARVRDGPPVRGAVRFRLEVHRPIGVLRDVQDHFPYARDGRGGLSGRRVPAPGFRIVEVLALSGTARRRAGS